ncbi:TetR/AcrR family transcriptional regulator (plasmid) [Cellulomonas sp. WB94]|uniref:TetR/AcrR family transcriptional regulator n=1 Tax=Cellulomonas sp. WB94 TaxID=2173174 RepID=UPI000D56C2F0|nr:TetR/AcrR family transcriptional regulator [Cellulomonas sp. WB94]PVU84471.1 TetR/AcrR family transcriptional regulator [Cellulomonas sp. WB94]
MTIDTGSGGALARSQTQGGAEGLRERNKRDKSERIFEVATRLFAEHGYGRVTTQQIAEAAEVGTGTLFRYVGSKAELLVKVMNERLRLGTEQGIELARQGVSPTDAILAMLAPLGTESLAHPENSIVYQRETLFGSGPHSDLAAQRVSQVEDAIRTVLQLHVDRAGGPRTPDLADVAHVIYATVYMDLVRVGVGRASVADLPGQIRHSIGFLVENLVPSTPDLRATSPILSGAADKGPR